MKIVHLNKVLLLRRRRQDSNRLRRLHTVAIITIITVNRSLLPMGPACGADRKDGCLSSLEH